MGQLVLKFMVLLEDYGIEGLVVSPEVQSPNPNKYKMTHAASWFLVCQDEAPLCFSLIYWLCKWMIRPFPAFC